MRGRRKSSSKLILFIAVAVVGVIAYFGLGLDEQFYTVEFNTQPLVFDSPNMVCKFSHDVYFDGVLKGSSRIFSAIPFLPSILDPTTANEINVIDYRLRASCNDSFTSGPNNDMLGWSTVNLGEKPILQYNLIELNGPPGFQFVSPLENALKVNEINMIEDVTYDIAVWTVSGNEIDAIMPEFTDVYSSIIQANTLGLIHFTFTQQPGQTWIANIPFGELQTNERFDTFKPPDEPDPCQGGTPNCLAPFFIASINPTAFPNQDLTDPNQGLDTNDPTGNQIEIFGEARQWTTAEPFPRMTVKQLGSGVIIHPQWIPLFIGIEGDTAIFRGLRSMAVDSPDGAYSVEMTIAGRTNPLVAKKTFYVDNIICGPNEKKENGMCVPDDDPPPPTTTIQGNTKFHYGIDFGDGSSVASFVPGGPIDLIPFGLTTDLGNSNFQKLISQIDVTLFLTFDDDETLSRFQTTQSNVILSPKMTVEGTEITAFSTVFPFIPENPSCTGQGSLTVCGPPNALTIAKIRIKGIDMFNQIDNVAAGDTDVPLIISASGNFNLLEGATGQNFDGVTLATFTWNMKYSDTSGGPPVIECVIGTPVPSPPFPPNKSTVCDPQVCIDQGETPITYETGKYYCEPVDTSGCPPGELKDVNGECKPPNPCPPGFVISPDGTQCIPEGGPPNTCTPPEVLIDNVCQIPPNPCPADEILIDGFCQPNACLLPDPPAGLCGGGGPGEVSCTVIGIDLPPEFEPVCNLISDFDLSDEDIILIIIGFVIFIIIVAVIRAVTRPTRPPGF